MAGPYTMILDGQVIGTSSKNTANDALVEARNMIINNLSLQRMKTVGNVQIMDTTGHIHASGSV